MSAQRTEQRVRDRLVEARPVLVGQLVVLHLLLLEHFFLVHLRGDVEVEARLTADAHRGPVASKSGVLEKVRDAVQGELAVGVHLAFVDLGLGLGLGRGRRRRPFRRRGRGLAAAAFHPFVVVVVVVGIGAVAVGIGGSGGDLGDGGGGGGDLGGGGGGEVPRLQPRVELVLRAGVARRVDDARVAEVDGGSRIGGRREADLHELAGVLEIDSRRATQCPTF